jgi:glycosyltransferase involved in cell wall biosynthesis
MSDKKHIAFCVSSLRVGGGERIMVDLANYFSKKGYASDLVALKSVGEFKNQLDPAVRLVSLDAPRIAFSLPGLVRYMNDVQPVSILALDEFAHVLCLTARMFAKTKPRIVLRVGTMFSMLFERYQGLKRFYWPFIIRRMYHKADAVIAVSHGMVDDTVAKTGVAREKITVIYQPKDLERLKALSQASVAHPWLSDKTVPVVIAVGRLREQKNFPVLIRAFARLSVPARLLILGKGRDENALKALIVSVGASDRIELVGFTDNPYALMGRADLFASTSLWEGMPNALLEAMVCGLPIISSDCASGPREILAPGSNYNVLLSAGIEYAKFGVLTAMNDEQALVDALTELLTNTERRSAYAAASIERARDFAAADRIEEYARVLVP